MPCNSLPRSRWSRPFGFASGASTLMLSLAAAGWLAAVAAGQTHYYVRNYTRAQESLSGAALEQVGLTLAWQTRVEVDFTLGKALFVTPHVSALRTHRVFELTHDRGRLYFSEHELDAFGNPVGVEGAKALAEKKKAALELRDWHPKISERVVPRATLYVATDQGIVHAIDGETGATRWKRLVGVRGHFTLEPAANDEFVAVVNGRQVHLLDAPTGKTLWSRDLRATAGAGPALSDSFVFVPMINGMVEGFEVPQRVAQRAAEGLKDDTLQWRRPSWLHVSHGRILMQPAISPTSLTWATDRGHLYVANANNKSIRYRLEADGDIAAPPVFQAGQRLFVTTIRGYVYCLDEITGEVLWRYSTGQAINTMPTPIGANLYVPTKDGGVYCVSIETGEELWWTPQVSRVLAGSQDRLYGVDSLGRLLVLSAKTGGKLATLPMEDRGLDVVNVHTDRMYLCSSAGRLQCLRELKNTLPVLHVDLQELAASKPPALEPAKPADDGAKPADAGKPADGEDPFKAPGKDPFGGASDPFGGGAKDPFGGGAPAGEMKKEEAKPDDNPFGF